MFEWLKTNPKYKSHIPNDEVLKGLSVEEYRTRRDKGNWPPPNEEQWIVRDAYCAMKRNETNV